MLHNIIRFYVIGSVLLFINGCGTNVPYKTVELEGTVSCQGKPLENVILTFSVEDKRPSSAVVLAGGKFKAVHSPSVIGVPIGPCVVRIGWDGQNDPPAEMKGLFEKYGSESKGLEIEITKPNKNYLLNFE
jgi:hypothetical protein